MPDKYNLPVLYENLDMNERRAVREQYIKEQNGLCFWCNHPLSGDPPKEILEKKLKLSLFPKNFLSNPIHLQHDHFNGLTEGAVHAYCNGVMWQYHGR